MRLRSKLAIRAAKLTSILIKKMKRGSGVTLPGYVARRIDPNILTAMAEQVRGKIIVTMGTNGKTTTNAILCRALESEGRKVIINRTGGKYAQRYYFGVCPRHRQKGKAGCGFCLHRGR